MLRRPSAPRRLRKNGPGNRAAAAPRPPARRAAPGNRAPRSAARWRRSRVRRRSRCRRTAAPCGRWPAGSGAGRWGAGGRCGRETHAPAGRRASGRGHPPVVRCRNEGAGATASRRRRSPPARRGWRCRRCVRAAMPPAPASASPGRRCVRAAGPWLRSAPPDRRPTHAPTGRAALSASRRAAGACPGPAVRGRSR